MELYSTLGEKDMLCCRCGFQIPFDDAVFCPYCGTKTDGKALEAEDGKALEAEKEYWVSQMRRKNELIPEKIKRLVDFQIRIEFLFVKRRLGLCHRVWNRKKKLYAHYGYEWYTPAELNPDIMFD